MTPLKNSGAGLRTISVILLTLALFVTAAPTARAQDSTPTVDSLRLIFVSGEGRVTASPDTARVMFGVESRNEELSTAQDEVSANVEKLSAMLVENGVAEDDVRTASYNVYPVNEYDRNGNVVGIDYYQVTLTLDVTIRDLEQVGTLLDQGVASGATYIGGISFFVDDPSPFMAQAREAAVNDARTKADEYARLSGAIITGVFSLNETSAPSPAAQDYVMSDAGPASGSEEASRSVPVSPGTTEIVVTIEVVYTIEPGNG